MSKSPETLRKVIKTARRFQKKMQSIVNDSPGIDKITVQFEGEKPITLAEKKHEPNAPKT